MSVYTVHEPPPRKGETSANPDRFLFVRDGFYFWAFLLGPIWMLWRRLWLAAVIYLAGVAVLLTALWAVDVPPNASLAVDVFLMLLIGLEAGSLWRWTLTRRGWKNLGVVVGDDLESAERRFFAAWSALPASAPAPTPSRTPRFDDSSIIGLFPQPGAPR